LFRTIWSVFFSVAVFLLKVRFKRRGSGTEPGGRLQCQHVHHQSPLHSGRAFHLTPGGEHAAHETGAGDPRHTGHHKISFNPRGSRAHGIARRNRYFQSHKPDFGDPVTILPDEIPVFWACGVTTTLAAISADLPLVITHSPGHMFVSDLRDETLTLL
jgi:hypothetical protein